MALSLMIVDDNEIELLCLKSFLHDVENIVVIGEAMDGVQAVKLAKQLKPDIIMLDVEMPEINGIEAAREIRKTLPSVFIIFTTAHPGYAVEAFEVNSTDYLVKPFQFERLKDSIERVKNDIKSRMHNLDDSNQALQSSNTLYVKQGADLIFIDTDTIIFIEKINRKTYVNTTKGIYEINLGLDYLQEKLDRKKFFRSFKSYIVNLNMVERITVSGENSYDVIFKNTDKKALMSRNNKDLLNKIIESSL